MSRPAQAQPPQRSKCSNVPEERQFRTRPSSTPIPCLSPWRTVRAALSRSAARQPPAPRLRRDDTNANAPKRQLRRMRRARNTVPVDSGKFRHDVVIQTRRSCREEEQVHRRADHIRVEAGRAGHACRGGLPQDGDQRRDFLHPWTAPNSKRKLTDTEVDCVPPSGVRASPSAQPEFHACGPRQLADLRDRYKSLVPCSPGSTGAQLVNSPTHRW